MSFSAAGTVPSPKKSLSRPASEEDQHSVFINQSVTKQGLNKIAAPWIRRSGPSPFLSSVSAAVTSAPSHRLLFQLSVHRRGSQHIW